MLYHGIVITRNGYQNDNMFTENLMFSENAFPFHHVLHVSKTKMKCTKFYPDVAEESVHVILTY